MTRDAYRNRGADAQADFWHAVNKYLMTDLFAGPAGGMLILLDEAIGPRDSPDRPN